jgi:hypothetical protein
MGTERLIMEGSINEVNFIRQYHSYASNDYTSINSLFIDGSIIHTDRKVQKGNRNVLISYERGYSSVPDDIKQFFLRYCKEMKDIQIDPTKVVSSKKVEGLAVNYFSPGEIISAKRENSLMDYATILKKYKNFTSISY